jgi:hypothetical protein
VQVRAQLSAFLSFVCCLATTGMRAWVVCVKRRLPEAGVGKMPSLELHIWQVPVAALAPWAFALNTHSDADPKWFLTSDGPVILGALHSIGVSPLQCRVKFFKQSMDRVYLLNLPVDAAGTPFQVLSSVASLAMKVVGGSRYTQEASALRKIAKSGGVEGFYALGAAPSEEAVWFQSEKITEEKQAAAAPGISFVRSLGKVEQKGWWSTANKHLDGGVIIMRPARPQDPTEVDRRAVAEGVKKTLKAAHWEGIVHTDIRPSNILFFGPLHGEKGSGGWQLVDFGLSTEAGSSVELQLGSSRARRSGKRIHELVQASTADTVSCTWDAEDDIAMLDGLTLPRSI